MQHAQEMGLKLSPDMQKMLSDAQVAGLLPAKTIAEQHLEIAKQTRDGIFKLAGMTAGGSNTSTSTSDTGGNGTTQTSTTAGGTGYNSGSYYQNQTGYTHYADGTDFVPSNGLAYLHAGEQIVPAGFRMPGPKGAAFTGTNLSSSSSDSIRRLDAIHDRLTRMESHFANSHYMNAMALRDALLQAGIGG
jgi:hypothetical protein